MEQMDIRTWDRSNASYREEQTDMRSVLGPSRRKGFALINQKEGAMDEELDLSEHRESDLSGKNLLQRDLTWVAETTVRCAPLAFLSCLIFVITWHLVEESSVSLSNFPAVKQPLAFAFLLELSVVGLSAFRDSSRLINAVTSKILLFLSICFTVAILAAPTFAGALHEELRVTDVRSVTSELERTIAAKETERESLSSMGYVSASRKISLDIDVLRQNWRTLKLRSEARPISQIEGYTLLIGRLLLVLCNCFFAATLARKFKALPFLKKLTY